jgi:hypothetical protein
LDVNVVSKINLYFFANWENDNESFGFVISINVSYIQFFSIGNDMFKKRKSEVWIYILNTDKLFLSINFSTFDILNVGIVK